MGFHSGCIVFRPDLRSLLFDNPVPINTGMKDFQTYLNESDMSVNKKYVQKIYSKAFQNPIGRGVVFSFKASGDTDPTMIRVELHPMVDTVHITEITVLEDKGGRGFGDHVMGILTKEADKMGVDLDLSAVPIAHQGKKIPKSKLVKFYKKHGFTSDGGDHMVRLTKKPIKLSGKMRTIDI